MAHAARFLAAGFALGTLATTGLALAARGRAAAPAPVQQTASDVPAFQFDPSWPKPLPNKWIVGDVVGLSVDANDHVWMVHRPRKLLHGFEDQAMYDPPEADCCVAAPAVIEFDQEGNVVQAWGGPGPHHEWPTSDLTGKPPDPRLTPGLPRGYDWPESEHSVLVDRQGRVWVSNNGGSHILKFTGDGQFLLQIGRKGQNNGSNDTESLFRPAGLDVDPRTNEVYVADGYGNRRVVVFDGQTGAYRRHWGAYGRRPDDTVAPRPFDPGAPPAPQFNTVHCVRISADGLVYVCDRGNNRIQVFRTDGTFVKEAVITPSALRGGVMAIAFSPDPEQRFLYVADGRNQKVWIVRRHDLTVAGSFGHAGHFAGGFTVAHDIAVDSKGSIYVAETLEGKRVQRFTARNN
jgi:sugar lactone lactonase YvrE